MDYPPFARVSSRDFFIDIWPIVIESDNITMKLSFDEFFLVQKMIPFFSFEKYLNITRVHVHCENSCVLFLLRCIGRSITGIFFFFFYFLKRHQIFSPCYGLRLRIHDCPFGIKTGERHAKFHKFFIIWTSYRQRLYITVDASMRSPRRGAEGNLNFEVVEEVCITNF